MVASAMAVELSGQVKATGTVMGYDGTDFTALSVDDFNASGDTKFAASVSGEKAGASIELKKTDAVIVPTFVEATVWVAPVDGLKFSLGKVATGSIAQGTFGWWAQNGKTEVSQGLKVECSFGAFGASAVLDCAWGEDANPWVKDGVGNFTAEANYNVDGIGKFQLVAAKGTQKAYGVGGWGALDYSFGIAYNNMPWGATGYFADVFFGIGDTNCIYSQIGGQFAANGFIVRLNNMVDVELAKEVSVDYGFFLRAEYAAGAFTPYAQIEANELISGKKMTIIAGSGINVGEAAIDVAVNVPVSFAEGSKFTFSMPISVTVAL